MTLVVGVTADVLQWIIELEGRGGFAKFVKERKAPSHNNWFRERVKGG